MIRLADRRRTPGIRLSSFRSGREDLADRLQARVYERGERDLLRNEVPEPVHRHRVQRVGDKPVAHRLIRPPRDLAGLPRRGQDRLDGIVDRAAVGDDGAGRLPRAERLGFDGLALSRRRFRVLVSSAARATVVRASVLELAIGPIVTIEDIADTPGAERNGAPSVSSPTRHSSDLRLALG